MPIFDNYYTKYYTGHHTVHHTDYYTTFELWSVFMFRLFAGTYSYSQKFLCWYELIFWWCLETKELKLVLTARLSFGPNPKSWSSDRLKIFLNCNSSKGCMFSFPAGCVGISLSFQEDPVNYCQQIYIFFILATLSTSKNLIILGPKTLNSLQIITNFKWLHLVAYVQKRTHHMIIL